MFTQAYKKSLADLVRKGVHCCEGCAHESLQAGAKMSCGSLPGRFPVPSDFIPFLGPNPNLPKKVGY